MQLGGVLRNGSAGGFCSKHKVNRKSGLVLEHEEEWRKPSRSMNAGAISHAHFGEMHIVRETVRKTCTNALANKEFVPDPTPDLRGEQTHHT